MKVSNNDGLIGFLKKALRCLLLIPFAIFSAILWLYYIIVAKVV